MQADNDLADYAIWDLLEIEKGLNHGQKVDVFVELDLPGDGQIRRLQMLPNSDLKNIDLTRIDPKNYSLKHLKAKELEVISEHIPQKERLLNFLIESEKRYPTTNTAVVIWGHGEGFSAGKIAQFGGVAVDDYPLKSKLSITEISEILEIYQNIHNKKIDLITFDACLMQTLEVAFELADYAKYLIGSLQIHDFRGLPYEEILQLFHSKQLSSYELAFQIPEKFEQYSFANEGSSKRTISAINLSELKNFFVPSLNHLGQNLESFLKRDEFLKFDLMDRINEVPFFLGETRDIADLLNNMSQFFYDSGEFSYYLEFQKAISSLDRSIVNYKYGEDYINSSSQLGSFKAFGIWMPANLEQFEKRSEDFKNFTLSDELKSWSRFQSSLYQIHL